MLGIRGWLQSWAKRIDAQDAAEASRDPSGHANGTGRGGPAPRRRGRLVSDSEADSDDDFMPVRRGGARRGLQGGEDEEADPDLLAAGGVPLRSDPFDPIAAGP